MAVVHVNGKPVDIRVSTLPTMPASSMPTLPGQRVSKSVRIAPGQSAESVETFTALRAYKLARQFRQRGIPVYGPPIFLRDEDENRAHAADERIRPVTFDAGVELLYRIVESVSATP